MSYFNQKGLTLIEILVCLIILSSGAVYVVQALAQSAAVQKRLEDKYPLYEEISNQMALSEIRIQQVNKSPLSRARGSFSTDVQRYSWSASNEFLTKAEKKAFQSRDLPKALMQRTVEAGWGRGNGREGIKIQTYVWEIFQEEKS